MKPRAYIYDLPLDAPSNPERGDYIQHTSLVRREVSWFIVIEARPVDSLLWGNRWNLTVRRLAPRDIEAKTWEGRRIWPSTPYRPGERPADRQTSEVV